MSTRLHENVGESRDNSEAARCANTERPLTRSLDLTEEGLAMKATRPAGPARLLRLSELKALQGDDPSVVWMIEREWADVEVVAHFCIDGEPMSKQRARVVRGVGGNVRAYTPEATKAAEAVVGWKFRAARPGWQPSKSETFGVMCAFFCATFHRRDVDNMTKLILDGLNGIAWVDDTQVSEISAKVRRGKADARTEVLIYRTNSSTPPTRPCRGCGEPIRVYDSTREKNFFCSSECGDAWRKDRDERTCVECGGTFSIHPSNTTRVTCSKACDKKRRTVEVACAHCGRSWSKPRSLVRRGARQYCDANCKAAYWRDHRTVAARGVCVDCGGSTSKKSYQRCQSCAILHARSK